MDRNDSEAVSMLVSSARQLAKGFVRPLGHRWEHSRAVVTRVAELGSSFPAADRDNPSLFSLKKIASDRSEQRLPVVRDRFFDALDGHQVSGSADQSTADAPATPRGCRPDVG